MAFMGWRKEIFQIEKNPYVCEHKKEALLQINMEQGLSNKRGVLLDSQVLQTPFFISSESINNHSS